MRYFKMSVVSVIMKQFDRRNAPCILIGGTLGPN